MTRRRFLPASAALPAALAAAETTTPIARKNRLKQSVCRWCYAKVPMEEFARECARLGLHSIDLMDPKEWPTAQKYGLIPTMTPGGTTIPEGFNRKENHAGALQRLRAAIDLAVAQKAPSIIIFSGNRRGMPDEEGLDNCVTALNQIKSYAEDKNILVCMELLNSKVDHKDYMCDHTRWGVEMIKRVNSPQIKLLYDIYHMQIMEGDVIRTIRDNFQYIGHYHTGGVPGRNEIDNTQELNYRTIAQAIVELGYKGYFAHEFIPKRDPLKSLAEAVELCDV